MDRLTRAEWAVGLVALPPVVVVLGWLALLALSAINGRHPIWNLEARNLSEAAAFRDGGAVVRRVNRGEDVNRAGEVRAGFVSDLPATMMPIEAAAAARQPEMVQLLLDLGASPDANTWQRAWCASDEAGVRDVLHSHRPAGASDDCAGLH